MADFRLSYQKTMSHEGGYVNDPSDRGGETYKGIARNLHPNWEGWKIVDKAKETVNVSDLNHFLISDNTLQGMILNFYKVTFWDALQLDHISEQEIADELFDTAVNQGVKSAAVYFQNSLNLLNNNQKHYSDILTDGVIGQNTLKAYRAYMLTANFVSRSQHRNINTLLKSMTFFQMKRYVDICERNQGQEVFFYGWLNRV